MLQRAASLRADERCIKASVTLSSATVGLPRAGLINNGFTGMVTPTPQPQAGRQDGHPVHNDIN